jgi:hypothetical protein
MKAYLIHLSPGQRFSGQLRVEYQDNGLLYSVINMTDIDTEDDLVNRISKVPLHERHLVHLKAKGVKITEVPADLSFERFWDKYHYKVGKKAKVQQLWTALNDADRTKALAAIPEYHKWLTRAKIAPVYPETYLSQRRWENDFTGSTFLFAN